MVGGAINIHRVIVAFATFFFTFLFTFGLIKFEY